ncbi:hypothetical protein [Klebsiella quasipneumoniae]|nr:hypothetical protein [Klebsiella quasipneumoniae]
MKEQVIRMIIAAVVGGQNSWELKRVKMAVFEGYVEKSDKIDVN